MDGLRAKEHPEMVDDRWSFDAKLQREDAKLQRKSEEIHGMKLYSTDPRKKSDIPLERAITDKILRWLRQQDKCWCFKVAGSGAQMRGVPDIVGCLDGRFFALEVKRPKTGRVSEIQKHMISLIADAGGTVGVVYSVEDVQRLLMGDE